MVRIHQHDGRDRTDAGRSRDTSTPLRHRERRFGSTPPRRASVAAESARLSIMPRQSENSQIAIRATRLRASARGVRIPPRWTLQSAPKPPRFTDLGRRVFAFARGNFRTPDAGPDGRQGGASLVRSPNTRFFSVLSITYHVLHVFFAILWSVVTLNFWIATPPSRLADRKRPPPIDSPPTWEGAGPGGRYPSPDSPAAAESRVPTSLQRDRPSCTPPRPWHAVVPSR